MMVRSSALVAFAFLLTAATGTTTAQAEVVAKAGILHVEREAPVPLSRLDFAPDDLGVAGAEVATMDNTTTGRFLKHTYALTSAKTTPDAATEALDAMLAEGVQYVIVIGSADDQLALADHAADRDALLFNASARDTRLRDADCRPNLFHTAPSRAMIADGLAQYMVWKKWTEWMLIHGSHPDDRLKADAYRRAARKFGAEIVEEREYEDTGGGRIGDSGHVLVQKQMPVFTQQAEDHDVVVIADESAVFGSFVPYRTWDPRPVVGDAGLIASMWHPGHESFGSTQLQRRFEKHAGRHMRDVDYQAWIALRALGEAVTRTNSAEPATVRAYMLGEEFTIAGFKGKPLSFRPWNNQLRNGVIMGDAKLVVSISPQEEFLHQRTRLDTLGLDEPESQCSF